MFSPVVNGVTNGSSWLGPYAEMIWLKYGFLLPCRQN